MNTAVQTQQSPTPDEVIRKVTSEQHHRYVPNAVRIDTRQSSIDEDARTVTVAFSSEEPVERYDWWTGEKYLEILGHDEGEVDLERFENGAAVLVNHRIDDHPAVIERAWLDNGVGRAVVRFGTVARAAEVFQNIVDGIWRNVSVGYFVREMQLVKTSEDDPDEYRITQWTPFELSFVAVPADVTVGVGRAVGYHAPTDQAVTEESLRTAINEAIATIQERTTMNDTVRATAPAGPTQAEIDAQVEAARAEGRSEGATSAVEAERNRRNEIAAAAEQYGAREIGDACIAEGVDIHEFNRRVLERNTGGSAIQAEDPSIGMEERDVNEFRVNRLLATQAFPPGSRERADAEREAGFELETSAAAAEKLKKDVRGVIIPYDVLIARRNFGVSTSALRQANRNAAQLAQQRAYSAGTAAAGGNLVATELLSESFIDRLENMLALAQLGVTMLTGLNGNIAIPRQVNGTSHFWLAEGDTPTESSATFDQVPLTPKTVGAYSEMSRRIMLQSSIDMELFTINELALRLQLAIDLAGIAGSGTGNQPTGVLNQAGVAVVPIDTNGGALTWAFTVALETAVAAANGDVGSLAYLTNAKVRGQQKVIFVDAGSGRTIYNFNGGGEPINGYRQVVSNQVPSNLTKGTGTDLSAKIFGNWADLMIGMWGGLDIQVNPYSLDTSGALRVTSFQDVDIAVRQAASFAVINDIVTA